MVLVGSQEAFWNKVHNAELERGDRGATVGWSSAPVRRCLGMVSFFFCVCALRLRLCERLSSSSFAIVNLVDCGL